MNTQERTPVARAHRVNKRLARSVWDAIHTFQTTFPTAVNDVVHTLEAAFSSVKSATDKKHEHMIVCCFKLGHFAGQEGKITFPVTLPDRIDRRWKLIAFKAVQAGIKFARSKM